MLKKIARMEASKQVQYLNPFMLFIYLMVLNYFLLSEHVSYIWPSIEFLWTCSNQSSLALPD